MSAPVPWLVVTTVGTREQARALARAMVDLRLTACAQIEAIDSVYRWQDAVFEEAEYRLLFKTVPERYPALQAALLARHPYEQPVVYAVRMQAADTVTRAWVANNSDGPPV